MLEGVVFKQIDKQFLVYSSFSRETLIVHELAYKLLLLLKTHPQTDEELIRRLNLEQQGLENNAQEFVSLTLEQFSRLGIVEII
ncbi:HPr-rel-A system PqqD family peptide chaperone [methane-oxidizing endosymbiont of Gigantopelta aegis]|uniref:HPr-rel-A system PqqD family peptide chaperone n=1 Tax=methane-oxidizing endosymbiont of Gigantopelta aegis TaxID=2794938 RepID=UPI001BE44567|nr:HPr-rel-A system PqqD family peptide chaperone [methane-oxidizing endosymbiont of Gigantopelta aegis]